MTSRPQLYQRTDVGTWMARWREGGRQRGHSFRTKDRKLAELLFKEWIAKWEAGHASANSTSGPKALESFLIYLADVEERRPATVSYYRKKLTPLFTAWADIPMHEWSRIRLDNYLAGLKKQVQNKKKPGRATMTGPQWIASDERLPKASKKKIVSACRRFIGWAQDRGYDCPDFVGRYHWGRTPAKRDKATLTPAQILAIVDLAREHRYLETPVALGAFAAIGEGDILSLDWRDVDLVNWRIRGARRKTGEPRNIPIIPPLRDTLSRAHLKQGRPSRGLVCASLPSAPNSIWQALRALEDRAGAPRAPRGEGGWHRYRRSCSTLLMQLGVQPFVRAAILSHADGSTMLKEYDQVSQRDLDLAMEKLAEAFEGAREA